MDKDIIAGKNPVLEALKSGRTINKILIPRGKNAGLRDILKLASSKKIPVQQVHVSKLDELYERKNHQGIIAFVAAKEYIDIDQLIDSAISEPDSFLLILDGLEDPHNFGAIIRTAEAFGCQGIIIPKRRSISLNKTVAKTSAGAIEYVPVSRVPNLVMTIEKLKKAGFWVIGCELTGESTLNDVDFKDKIAVVIGGEGKGVSRLVAENCDILTKIPMKGQLNSLNASVAASIVMYELLRQRMNS